MDPVSNVPVFARLQRPVAVPTYHTQLRLGYGRDSPDHLMDGLTKSSFDRLLRRTAESHADHRQPTPGSAQIDDQSPASSADKQCNQATHSIQQHVHEFQGIFCTAK